MFQAGKLEDDEDEEDEDESTVKGALYLLAGGILIILFSSPFITSIVEISKLLKVNPSLLAFFLAPVASEAPEILESITLSRKGKIQSINIAYSNLIGGTITKTTLLCGVSSNIQGLSDTPIDICLDLLFLRSFQTI